MLKKPHSVKKVSSITWKLLGAFLFIFLMTSVLTTFWVQKKDFDVDLVYLWCDGADPQFQERKDYYLKTSDTKLPWAATSPGRFLQVNELKYSLRSVEKYLPWVHHIYIVTDRQVPVWLNTKHPKITIVDHSEIIDQKHLPTFNSSAIEAAIHKIPNLSEHFLLANDDTFVNYPLDKDFFFKNGKPIIRMKKMGKKRTLYRKMLRYSISLMERDFGQIPPFSKKDLEPHHNIDAYLKSDYTDCAQHFEKEFTETLSHRFRQKNSLHRIIVAIWSFSKGHAEIKNVSVADNKNDSSWMSNKRTNYLRPLRKNNPALFCVNDNEKARKKDRQRLKAFLKDYFPWKSQFEL